MAVSHTARSSSIASCPCARFHAAIALRVNSPARPSTRPGLNSFSSRKICSCSVRSKSDRAPAASGLAELGRLAGRSLSAPVAGQRHQEKGQEPAGCHAPAAAVEPARGNECKSLSHGLRSRGVQTVTSNPPSKVWCRNGQQSQPKVEAWRARGSPLCIGHENLAFPSPSSPRPPSRRVSPRPDRAPLPASISALTTAIKARAFTSPPGTRRPANSAPPNSPHQSRAQATSHSRRTKSSSSRPTRAAPPKTGAAPSASSRSTPIPAALNSSINDRRMATARATSPSAQTAKLSSPQTTAAAASAASPCNRKC